MRIRAAFGLTLLPLFLFGCAEIARPPGGPIDQAGPAVLHMSPDSLEARVDPMRPVVITFSEKVDHDSIREWLVITPYRRVDDYDWTDKTLSFLPRGGWPPDTTISILLGSGVTDRSLNRLGRPFQRTFSTADSVHPGVFAGRILRSRSAEPSGRGAPATDTAARGAGTTLSYVWVYRAGGDSLPDPATDSPDYQTEVEPGGVFRVEGIAPGGYWLYAIQDVDRRRTFSKSQDYATRHPDALRVDPTRQAWTDLQLYLINPKEPGGIAGRLAAVDTAAGVDTLTWGVLVSPAPAEGDTTAPWPPLRVSYSGRVDKGGTFRLAGIAPGSWRIAAWLDANRDARWNSDESVGPPVPVAVESTVMTQVEDLQRPAVPD